MQTLVRLPYRKECLIQVSLDTTGWPLRNTTSCWLFFCPCLPAPPHSCRLVLCFLSPQETEASALGSAFWGKPGKYNYQVQNSARCHRERKHGSSQTSSAFGNTYEVNYTEGWQVGNHLPRPILGHSLCSSSWCFLGQVAKPLFAHDLGYSKKLRK